MVRPASAITCSTLARLTGWWMVSMIRISGIFIRGRKIPDPIIPAMKRLIAIVEDEPAIRDNYAAAFTREGYVVRTYGNRAQAMEAFAARLPDLAVIDISLEDEPEGGFELCRQLRALSAELPIIFLTARDSELDAVSGLRLGADDFLTKDLSLAHLSARVNALFRRVDALRKPHEDSQLIQRGPLKLDAERMQVQWEGKVVLLSLTE